MFQKRLSVERLEDRRMLAAFSVSTLNDSGIGSLRDAIAEANAAAGADTISFAANLSGGTINLTGGELVINQALTIDARSLSDNITINANQLSRVIYITPNTGDFFLGGLKLTGGKTTVNGSSGFGAAIRSNSRGELTLSECHIVGNTVTGANSGGGGISSRSLLTVEDSIIENNSTTRARSGGGGIYALVGTVTITRSTIRGNSTAGDEAAGGGIWVKDALSLSNSTVSENKTMGTLAHGGGIFAAGNVSLYQSTVSSNTTSASTAHGAGIYTSSSVALTRSTVTNNRLLAAGANGGGVYVYVIGRNQEMLVDHSILSANRDSSSYDNYFYFGDRVVSQFIQHSLVGHDVLISGTASQNIESNDPLLGPLANNGGPTETHALLPGSPAINAGDWRLVADTNDFDQRGTPYKRFVGSRIDIGAYESAGFSAGDFDQDGDVDGRDFLRWQRGGSPAPLSSGDLNHWQGQYGTEGLSAISDPLSTTTGTQESSDTHGAVGFLPTPVGEAASEKATLVADDYKGEVDRAFAELGNTPRGTARDFGEIAVRRASHCRAAKLDLAMTMGLDTF